MSDGVLNRFTAAYMSYVLFALLLLNVRSSLTLVAVILAAGRRRRRLMLEQLHGCTAALLRSAPSLLLQTHRVRSHWMSVKSKDWWERVVLKEFTDDEWRENFRMSRGSFRKLCGLMEPVLSPQEVTVRAPIPLPMRVAMVLYKLARGAGYGAIADRFGVHKSTVKKCVYGFCKGMMSSVIQGLVRTPTAEEARVIAHRFEQKFNIPQIIGCIDRTHIPVLAPTDGYKDFRNRKGWPSYVLQGVVDDMYRFWDISCKMPGCADDTDVLVESALFARAHLLPKEPRDIDGTPVNLFLLGDPGYPLLDWLIKDYGPSPLVTHEQEAFNAYLSAARTTVELAFVRLKSRWRVLLKRSDFHFTFSPLMAASCCALHNFCESEGEDVNPSWTEEAAILELSLPQPGVLPYDEAECPDGQRVRLALTEYLSRNFPLCAPVC